MIVLSIALVLAFQPPTAPEGWQLATLTIHRSRLASVDYSKAVQIQNATVDVEAPPQILPEGLDATWVLPDGKRVPAASVELKGKTLSIAAPANASKATLVFRGVTDVLEATSAYHLDYGDAPSGRLTFRLTLSRQAGQPLEPQKIFLAMTAVGDPKSNLWDETRYELPASPLPAQFQRIYRAFDEEVTVEEIVEAKLGAMRADVATADSVRSVLKLANRTAVAWPTAPIHLYRDGKPRGTASLPVAAPGQSVEVDTGAALGVVVKREEVELERKLSPIRRENEPPDRIQTAGTVTVSNRRAISLRIRVIKPIEGEALASSDEGKMIRVPNRLGVDQPLSEIRWEFVLPAGQTKKLTYGTSLQIAPVETKENR
jgi:hypothetical protein